MFLADQDSSIGDHVTHSLTQSVIYLLISATMTTMTTMTKMTTILL